MWHSLPFASYDTDWSLTKNLNIIKKRYIEAKVEVEEKRFDFEYDKVMFEEKKKNIEEIKELIKQYQWKLQGIPERIRELEAIFESKKSNYDQLEEQYMKKHQIYYYDKVGKKLQSFRWELRVFKSDRYDYVYRSKGMNFANQLEHRYLVQEELVKKQMCHEIKRRIKKGQKLQEEMLDPSIEKVIRRYREARGQEYIDDRLHHLWGFV